MKYFDWDELKNSKLKADRDICFEDIVTAINEGKIWENIHHPNQTRYPNQKVLTVEINRYIYVVPYAEDDTKIFFKTIYPSRKLTKKYVIERRK